MNYIYVGKPADYNIGNGKTSSAVGAILSAWAHSPDKTIFSNIELKNVPYEQFTPHNLDEVLETKNALVLLDELHAIVHKKHMVHERCTAHVVQGLCYRLSEFFRQVRKRGINTYSTCQTFDDAAYQYRQLMNVQVECEKYHLEGNKLKKCKPDYITGMECPTWHKHLIKQRYFPGSIYDKPHIFDPEPIYDYYNSFEIVKGWVSFE